MQRLSLENLERLLLRLRDVPYATLTGMGRCDCGTKPRHRNGGNYHPEVAVVYSFHFREYLVSLQDSREFVPGFDEWGDCPCLEESPTVPYRRDEEHFHSDSPEDVAWAIISHLGPGGSVYLRNGVGGVIEALRF